jgi:preprotein translocase subunit YajC
MQYIFLPAVLIIGLVLMTRSQRRRQAEAIALRNRAAVGDEILTTSGIYGIVTAMDDEDIWLEVSANNEIRMARGAILRVSQSVEDPEVTEPTEPAELPEHAGSADTESEPEA